MNKEIYINLCVNCSREMWWKEPHKGITDKRFEWLCYKCKDTKNVYDSPMLWITYSGNIMDDVTYEIMNKIQKEEEVKEEEKKVKLVFWKSNI